MMFFLSLLTNLDFDALPFHLRAMTRGFLFLLAPAFLFGSQSIFRRKSRRLYLRATAFFFGAQSHQFGFQPTDLCGGADRDCCLLIMFDGRYCRRLRRG